MEIEVHPNLEVLSHAAAKIFVTCAKNAIEKYGKFSCVLTGGSTPARLYELLANKPYKDQVQWENTHIFWGDERWVHHDDARNNAKMAYELLLNHVPVPSVQISRMSGELSPENSALEYELILKEFFQNKEPRFDLVLLGMGADGHVASLFPGKDVISEKNSWVKSLYLEDQKIHRITLTFPVINAASQIIILVSGKTKSSTIKTVLQGGNNPPLPVELISPASGNLKWLLDKDAAEKIELHNGK